MGQLQCNHLLYTLLSEIGRASLSMFAAMRDIKRHTDTLNAYGLQLSTSILTNNLIKITLGFCLLCLCVSFSLVIHLLWFLPLIFVVKITFVRSYHEIHDRQFTFLRLVLLLLRLSFFVFVAVVTIHITFFTSIQSLSPSEFRLLINLWMLRVVIIWKLWLTWSVVYLRTWKFLGK